jgi:hypothetical protein
VGFKYREYDVGGGRSRILGNSIPRYCSYCGDKLEEKVIDSGRFDRQSGRAIEIAVMDCPVRSKTGVNIANHECYYIDDPIQVSRVKKEITWKEYLNKDA